MKRRNEYLRLFTCWPQNECPVTSTVNLHSLQRYFVPLNHTWRLIWLHCRAEHCQLKCNKTRTTTEGFQRCYLSQLRSEIPRGSCHFTQEDLLFCNNSSVSLDDSLKMKATLGRKIMQVLEQNLSKSKKMTYLLNWLANIVQREQLRRDASSRSNKFYFCRLSDNKRIIAWYNISHSLAWCFSRNPESLYLTVDEEHFLRIQLLKGWNSLIKVSHKIMIFCQHPTHLLEGDMQKMCKRVFEVFFTLRICLM